MENNKSFLAAALVCVLLVSCVKGPQDIPAGMTTDPVFGLSGSLGSQGLSIDAGENGWTVQPSVHDKDSNLVYTSLFSIAGCIQDCSPSFEFRFYRELPSANNPLSGFQQTIKPGNIGFVDADVERDSFEITLSTHPGLFMSGFSYWQDLNVPGTSFFAEYASVVGFSDNLNVCFQSHAFTGCQYSQCISFDPKTLVPCLAHIEASIENDSIIRLVVQPEQGTPPFNYLWANNEFTTAGMFLPLQNNVSEIYADVTVTDALGNFTNLKQIIRIQNGNIDACYFPISMMSKAVFNSSPEFAAGKAEVVYRDENGVEWRSTSGTQSLNNSLSISGVEFYDLSPLAQETYKISFNTTVELFNVVTGESKKLVLQNAVIPLSHP